MLNDDYEVGYGKPPQQTQFKPGQSGNRRGRPKKQQDLASVVARELLGSIHVKQGDKISQIPVLDAIAKAMIAKALRGDQKAPNWLLKHLPEDKLQSVYPSPEDIARQKKTKEFFDEKLQRLAEQEQQREEEWQQRDARREQGEAACRILREQGIAEQVINDARGVKWMAHEDRKKRQERAVLALRSSGVSEELIAAVLPDPG